MKISPLSSNIVLQLMTLLSLLFGHALSSQANQDAAIFLSYIVDPHKQDIRFYWKDPAGINYANFYTLRKLLGEHGRELVFAANGGMFDKHKAPVGLYVENGKTLRSINKRGGQGNFYLKPNGVFAITKGNDPILDTTKNFTNHTGVKYATQSGPMLLINGKINPAFRKNSRNLHIRNAVGILPDGRVIFVLSKRKVSFYQLADYFKRHKCKDALYLDGYVSRTYLPAKAWEQLDGDFGVIIAVIKQDKKNSEH